MNTRLDHELIAFSSRRDSHFHVPRSFNVQS